MEKIKWIRGNSKFPKRVKAILNMNSSNGSRYYCHKDDKCIFSIIYGVVHCVHADTDLAKAIIENGEELKMDDTFPPYEFKPFNKVLVRDSDKGIWQANFFSQIQSYDENRTGFLCVQGFWKQCIPYEGNEDLLGTNLNPK